MKNVIQAGIDQRRKTRALKAEQWEQWDVRKKAEEVRQFLLAKGPDLGVRLEREIELYELGMSNRARLAATIKESLDAYRTASGP